MLEVKNLSVSYGAIEAVKDISFTVNDGEIVSLIGANGAGKTTTLHTITGLVPAKSGSMMYNGVDLLKTHNNKIVTLGMAHIPEGRHVFTRMSVEENLEMGAFSLKDQSDLKKDLDMVYGLFPRLKERRNQKAGTLSGGEQQMLAMGRALMSHPKTILMDEPSMGLSPKLVKEIFSIIRKLHEQGITILLVEQNAKMALSIATVHTCWKPAVSRWKATPRNCSITSRCARRIWALIRAVSALSLGRIQPTGLFLYPMEYSPVVFPPFGRAIEPCLTIGKLTG